MKIGKTKQNNCIVTWNLQCGRNAVDQETDAIPCPAKLIHHIRSGRSRMDRTTSVHELHNLRIAVRDLLVRCETALGFYQTDKFFQGEMPYTTDEQTYALGKGAWMKQNYWIVRGVSTAFLVLLWLKQLTCLEGLIRKLIASR